MISFSTELYIYMYVGAQLFILLFLELWSASTLPNYILIYFFLLFCRIPGWSLPFNGWWAIRFCVQRLSPKEIPLVRNVKVETVHSTSQFQSQWSTPKTTGMGRLINFFFSSKWVKYSRITYTWFHLMFLFYFYFKDIVLLLIWLKMACFISPNVR